MARTFPVLYKRVYDAVNYRLRTVAGGRFASLCRPTWISLLITERCNARCVHCDIWRNRGKEDSPTAEQWREALANLREWLGPTHVHLTGGEALLMPHTVDLVRHGASLGLLIEVLTHGYWRDQSRIEAMARAGPWRVTLSVDGLGDVHSRIRGREGFFERTQTSIETLKRVRKEDGLDFTIRLKTVVMQHNLGELAKLARFATQDRMDIFFQPIEQNYNTEEDPQWFLHSQNWPTDPGRAIAAVEELIRLKKQGLSIANSIPQLEVMIPYFQDPAAWRVSVQSHTAHDTRRHCSSLALIQVQSNGDVRVCASAEPVGNIKRSSLREIWENRPQWWTGGCCRERRLTQRERPFFDD